MKSLRLQIRHADGRTEVLWSEGATVLIGNGAHCDVRLPIGTSAPEHVALLVAGGILRVEARGFDPPPTLQGAPFTQTVIPEGQEAVLAIGQTQIGLVYTDRADGKALAAKAKNSASPLTYLLFALCMIFGVYALQSSMEDDDPGLTFPKAPALWDDREAVCPKKEVETALAFASERKAVADMKRDRHPFHVQDGVAAVPLYELARACFKAAGAEAEANDAAQSAKLLRTNVDKYYHRHRVSLEHALTTGDRDTQRYEANALLALASGQQGEYVTWLATLERNLRMQNGSQSETK